VLSLIKTFLFPVAYLFFLCFLFEGPLHFACIAYPVKQSFTSFPNGTTNFATLSQTLWITFWPAKTSHKPISLTARLAVNPNSSTFIVLAQLPGFKASAKLPSFGGYSYVT